MKFVEVNELPKRGYKRNGLKAELDYFMYMRTKTVKVEWNDRYETAKKAANNIARSIQRWAFPIDVRRFGDDVYLIRRDM